MTDQPAHTSARSGSLRSQVGIAVRVCRSACMVVVLGVLPLLTGCQFAGRSNAGFLSGGSDTVPSRGSALPAGPLMAPPPAAAAAALSAAIQNYHAGQPEAALASLSRARQLDPGPRTAVPALELTARIRFDQADHRQGVAALQELVLAAGNDADLLNRCGTQLMRAGATAEALPPLRRAADLAPRQSNYARDLAAALVQSGQSAMALSVLEAAAEHSPASAELTAAMGLISEQQHRWTDAAGYYRHAVAHGLNSVSWQRRLAESQYHAELYTEASQIYARILGRDFRQGTLEERVRFADAAIRTRQFQLALEVLDNLTAELPHSSAELETLRATCAWELGHHPQAEGIVADALRHWPDDEQLTALHGFFLSTPGSSDRPPELQPDLPQIVSRTARTAEQLQKAQQVQQLTGSQPGPELPVEPVPQRTAAPADAAPQATAAKPTLPVASAPVLPAPAITAPLPVAETPALSVSRETPMAGPGQEVLAPPEPATSAAAGQGGNIELSSWKSTRPSDEKTDRNRSAAESPAPAENWKPRPRWAPSAGSGRPAESPAAADEPAWQTPRKATADTR
ncbi:MAG: hypothetical protein KDA79_03085 [Planctomycetaceae bacterium]|nr:hypothetical protein [Planctomycetaceae bacterium]